MYVGVHIYDGGENVLIGMSLIQEVVETILCTGMVKGASPISLLLIADPELMAKLPLFWNAHRKMSWSLAM